MKKNIDAVTKAALSLSRSDRELVNEWLVASLVQEGDSKVRRAQLVEVRRRRREVLSGKVKTIPGGRVLREIQN